MFKGAIQKHDRSGCFKLDCLGCWSLYFCALFIFYSCSANDWFRWVVNIVIVVIRDIVWFASLSHSKALSNAIWTMDNHKKNRIFATNVNFIYFGTHDDLWIGDNQVSRHCFTIVSRKWVCTSEKRLTKRIVVRLFTSLTHRHIYTHTHGTLQTVAFNEEWWITQSILFKFINALHKILDSIWPFYATLCVCVCVWLWFEYRFYMATKIQVCHCKRNTHTNHLIEIYDVILLVVWPHAVLN